MALMKAARIVLWMGERVVGQCSNRKAGASREDAIHSKAHVLVSDEKDEVFACLAAGHHPSTPAAKRTPRLVSPCQFCSAGCFSPETISLAPSSALAKHSTWSGLTIPRMT